MKAVYNDQYFVYSDAEHPNTKMPYSEFVASHPIFFWKDPFNRVIKFENQKFVSPVECGKPVIYLYPETPTTVSVKIEPQGGMTVSNPEYNEGWLVNASPDGNLTEISSGKAYPYLFWEGRGGLYETPEKGWVVKEAEVHDFLLEKLTQLGLNAKESADFREFWEPRMTGSPYFFITFLGTKDMDRLAPLEIDPKPDTIFRILMDYEPLDAPKEVEEFSIRTPQRKGFTVVEWGGVLR